MSQIWPPIRDYRVKSRFSIPLIVLLILLALMLIGGGLGFIVYSANVQYRHALRADATAVVQTTHYAVATTKAQGQATVDAVSTVQANVAATNTAAANVGATATATVDSVTATVSAFGDLYNEATTGRPALDDPLTDNKGDGKWEGSNQGGINATHTGCAFGSDGYHVSEAQQGNFQPCFAQVGSFGDMAYQVAMTFLKGSRAQGGVLLRADSSRKSYYFFRISMDGSYAFDVYTSSRASTLTSGFSAAITASLNQPNQVAVIAKGKHFYLYVNGQYVDDVSDGTLTSGSVGVAVVDASTPVDAIMSNAQVWKL